MRLGLRRVRPAQDAAQPAAQRAAAMVEPPAPATASTASSAAASAAPVAPAAPAPPTPASEASQDAAEATPSLAEPARAAASPAESSAAAGASALAQSAADRAALAPAADKPKKRGWLGFMRRSAPEKPEVGIPVCFPLSESKQLLNYFAYLKRNKAGGVVTSREVAQLPELAFNPFVLRVAEVIEDESDSPDLCQGEMDARMFLLLLSVFHHATPEREKMEWAFKCFDYDRDGVLSRDDLVEAFSLIHSTVPVAEIELKVELVMEAAGKDKDENLGPADFEALMDPYSFQRLFTIHY